MLDTIFDNFFTSEWLVVFVVGLLLLVSAELGFRFGLRLHHSKDVARIGQIGRVQGAMLGLLGLLLSFTFAMSASRYDTRRQLVLQESNSIGTTYLRASFLPDAHRKAVEDLLRSYVQVRLDFYNTGKDEASIRTAEKASALIQSELWTHAVAAGKEAPTPITATFINALNDTIDLDATRVNALRSHVPGAVWLLVLAVAVIGCAATGYGAGASGARSGFSNIVLPLLVTVVFTLIADLDRPRGGLIGISQQPMIDLKQSLAKN